MAGWIEGGGGRVHLSLPVCPSTRLGSRVGGLECNSRTQNVCKKKFHLLNFANSLKL